MMAFHNKLIKAMNLEVKIDCEFDCYLLASKRYIIFHKEIITQENCRKILENIEIHCKTPIFSKWKSIIVVGTTTESFNKEDLLYFNGLDTFVCFYLINAITNEHYMNKQWIFTLGLNYRKYIKKIEAILQNKNHNQ